jgi:hypothetical protein
VALTAVGTARRALPPAVRGSVHHGLVLAATAVTVLLASTVLAALAALATSAVDRGAATRLAADPRAEVQVTAVYTAAGLPAADRAVRGAVATVFGDVPEHTYLGVYGPDPLSVRGAASGSAAAQIGLHAAAVQGAAAHARLVSGRWPTGTADVADGAFAAPTVTTPAGGTVDAAIPRLLARRLRVGAGAELHLLDATRRAVAVRVTGVYVATGAPGFWPGVVGSSEGGDAVAGNLLVVSPAALLGDPALSQEATADWSTLPDLSRLRAAQLPGLRHRIGNFAAGDTGLSVFHGRPPALGRVVAVSSMADALDDLAVPMVVARSALYLPSALLAVLALAALILTARQLASHRRDELVLRQTRGAGTRRLLAGAAGEWAVVALPAVLVAPFLAGPLLRGLHATGLLAVQPPASTLVGAVWAAVALTALVHAAATLLPVLMTVTGGDALSRLRLRGARGAAVQRVGADLALLLVTVLGYLQLAHYRSTVSGSGVDGVSDVDPVLVLVPAVAALAAALLLLRMLPLVSFALDRFGRWRRGLALPLAAWQLGRRSERNAGPVVLMCLAVAVGALATTALAGLDGLATDQARFSVGADVRVDQQDSLSAPPEVLRSALAALPGVTAVTPVTQSDVTNPAETLDQLVGIDTGPLAPGGAAPPVPMLRADLAGPGFASRVAALGRRVPVHGLPLAGRPTALRLDETLSTAAAPAPPRLVLTLEDAAGTDSTVTVRLPPADGARHLVDVPLTPPNSAGFTRTYPLTLTGIAVLVAPDVPLARLTLAVHRIGAVGTVGAVGAAGGGAGAGAGAAVSWSGALPDGGSWADLTPSATDARNSACGTGHWSLGYIPGDPGVCTLTSESGLFTAVVSTGAAQQGSASRTQPQGEVVLGPSGGRRLDVVPVLADQTALSEGHYAVGGTEPLVLDDGTTLTVRIAGSVAAVPGTDRLHGYFLVDQRALAAAEAFAGSSQEPPSTWWLNSGDPGRTAAAVGRDPLLGTATTVGQVRGQLLADPFGAGMRAVLALCRLLAPGFAVIGFTVHAVVTTRERRREFALLRAMGVRRGGLSLLLWAEQVGVAAFAVVPGALLGVGLAVVVLPLVTVDDTGAAPFPSLRVVVPWVRVGWTALATAGAICVVVMSLARLLARVDLVRVLRAGEGT